MQATSQFRADAREFPHRNLAGVWTVACDQANRSINLHRLHCLRQFARPVEFRQLVRQDMEPTPPEKGSGHSRGDVKSRRRPNHFTEIGSAVRAS